MKEKKTKKSIVLSPSMMVLKRFLRNRLAITGLVILVFMFLFSFTGVLFTPYGETEVFRKEEVIQKDYAGAVFNQELRFNVRAGHDFPATARSRFLRHKNAEEGSFLSGDITYTFLKTGEVYRIFEEEEAEPMVLASAYTFDSYQQGEQKEDFDFRLALELAVQNNLTGINYQGRDYIIHIEADGADILTPDGNVIAALSRIIVNPRASDAVLSMEFKEAVRAALTKQEDHFTVSGVDYLVNLANGNYYITTMTKTSLINVYEAPDRSHLLGLDGNGMDVLTRLMYGGRVSLMVGFVVVFIEILIGVIFGGISGYFGGWIDTVLMRFVDLFNSIPFWPLCLIIGSVMDTLDITPGVRIFILMVLLGALGWTGIARVVRGQILSLREQDFMLATEATGIRVRRRIFKHLVPNVMPLLIVQATMGLGGIILTEATLSFLGLGVKYPMASWGNIINAATDIYVMRNYWFIWIPAGVLILLAVLGFNFVGDGLRDAFDPKMKR